MDTPGLRTRANCLRHEGGLTPPLPRQKMFGTQSLRLRLVEGTWCDGVWQLVPPSCMGQVERVDHCPGELPNNRRVDVGEARCRLVFAVVRYCEDTLDRLEVRWSLHRSRPWSVCSWSTGPRTLGKLWCPQQQPLTLAAQEQRRHSCAGVLSCGPCTVGEGRAGSQVAKAHLLDCAGLQTVALLLSSPICCDI